MNFRPTALAAATAAALSAVLATAPAASAATVRPGAGPVRPSAAVARPGSQWSATWAAAMQPAVPDNATTGANWSEQGFTDQTIRQVIRVTSGGRLVRIRLSNQYGSAPLRVAGATIARTVAGAAIEPRTLRRLTFRGARSATIPAGQVMMSDAAALRVAPLGSLTITLYLTGPTGPATFHDDGLTTTYQAGGSHLSDTGAAAFAGGTSHSFYYLAGVDLISEHAHGTVVAFGDSITNGHNSTAGGNDRYTDDLADRLVAAHRRLAVVNEGITGNLLLHQLPCFGDAGITRFGRAALGQPGVRTVILLEGANDIWDYQDHGCGVTPAVTAQQIISGYRALIKAAHARGIRVIGATILPFKAFYEQPGDFARAEAIRQTVNKWIRTSGQYDGVADFAAAVADPADPQQLSPAYNSGDYLHPNDAGYQAIAAAINLSGL